MDCGLDIRFKEKDGDGDYEVEFIMPGAKDTTKRWFKDAESALRMAHFVAAQQGVNNAETLYPWLEARGFPGRDPGDSDPRVEILEDSNESGGGVDVAPDSSVAPEVDNVEEPKSKEENDENDDGNVE